MAMQSVTSFGGTAPQPAPSQGEAPRPVAPQRDAVAAEAVKQAISPPAQPSREQVEKAVEEVRKSVAPTVANNLQFSVDDETGKTVVRVTDVQTGELIRQIPSEEMVELAKALDKMQGMLLRQQA